MDDDSLRNKNYINDSCVLSGTWHSTTYRVLVEYTVKSSSAASKETGRTVKMSLPNVNIGASQVVFLCLFCQCLTESREGCEKNIFVTDAFLQSLLLRRSQPGYSSVFLAWLLEPCSLLFGLLSCYCSEIFLFFCFKEREAKRKAGVRCRRLG